MGYSGRPDGSDDAPGGGESASAGVISAGGQAAILSPVPASGCQGQVAWVILEIRMANTLSAQKRVRIAERRTAVNRTRKTRLRYQIRAMRRLLAAKDAKGAAAEASKTFSVIDRA